MSDVVNAELLKLATDGAAEEYWHACADPALKASKLAAFVKSRLQAEAPTNAEVAEIAERRRLKKDEPADLCDWDDLAESNGVLCRDIDYLLAKLRAITSAQAEAQAPTTAAQASVLTEDERAEWKALCYEVLGTTSTDESLIYWCCKSTKLAALLLRFIEPTSTVGAPAPAPTVPTREQIARVIAKDAGCDLGYSQEFVRCIREIHNCGCAKRADAILALFAKGDTP